MKQQALFTFSPDGTKVYAFYPSGKLASFVLIAFICVISCLALALIEIASLAGQCVHFLLTANSDVLTRLGGFGVFLLLMVICLTVLQYLRLRSATASVGAPA